MGKRSSNGNGNGQSHRKLGECPHCQEYRKLTHHHILPKRHWKGKGPGLKLCWECHCELENLIALAEGKHRHRLSMRKYFRITAQFLHGADDGVINHLMNQFTIQQTLVS